MHVQEETKLANDASYSTNQLVGQHSHSQWQRWITHLGIQSQHFEDVQRKSGYDLKHTGGKSEQEVNQSIV